ncbi:MAG: hypothetical protein ACYDFT_08680, partial [Thermoplasmata archaeon]
MDPLADPSPRSPPGRGWLRSALRRIGGGRGPATGAPGSSGPTGARTDPGAAAPPAPVAPGPPPLPGAARAAVGPERSGTCPNCQVPYLPAGPAGRFGCPLCGRHLSVLPAAGPTRGAPPSGGRDRGHEELLARGMLGRP